MNKKTFIYKYVKYDDAISVIRENSVSLGNPLRFNDPFDCFIGIDEKKKIKSKKLLEEFFYIKKLLDLIDSNELNDIKYQSVEKTLTDLDRKIRTTRKFTSHPYLYKMALSTIGELSTNGSIHFDSIEKEKDEFINIQTKRLMGFQESALVSCFCTRYDSILMWGHYAERDRGVCIEYEKPTNGNFYNVKYQKKRIPYNIYKVTSLLLGYLFTNDEVDESDDSLVRSIIEPFLTKSFEWKYEDEIRCIFSRFSKNNDIYSIEKPSRPDGVQYLYRMPTKITRIFLGCKISNEREQNIIKIANELNIPVFKMKPNNDLYRLDSKEINGEEDE